MRRTFLLALGTLACFACFDEPVSEKVHVEVLPESKVEITAEVEFHPPGGNAAMTARVDALRAAILDERDPWVHRFSALSAQDESFSWQRRDGKLVHAERSARTDDNRLPWFFSDTGLTVSVTRFPGGGELTIIPGRSTRATDTQRREVDSQLAHWSKSFAKYLEAEKALYEYLDEHPDRNRAMIAPFFSDELTQEERDALIEPEGREKELAEQLGDAMNEVAAVLDAGETEAYTIDELSRLSFDPFPSDLTISFPANIAEAEGFRRLDSRRVEVRRAGLWDAAETLAGHWMKPDLIVPWIAMQRGEKVDLDALLKEKRTALAVPSAEAVQREIEGQLKPASLYRVRWGA